MYKEYSPAPELLRYIDAYWTSTTGFASATFVQRILPDTCTDIICNLGADLHAVNVQNTVLKADCCYLLGTMTRFSDVTVNAGTKVFAIRFKPFGLRALLGFSLSGTGNARQHLGEADFNFKKFVSANGIPDLPALNRFFLDRLPQKRERALEIMQHIVTTGGRLTVSDIAVRHHISERQLERLFGEYAGVSVKELCSQLRLLRTIKALKSKDQDTNLLSLAIDHGYYDHAHLGNSIRKYTGYTPSHFIK